MTGIRDSVFYWIILVSVEAAFVHSQDPCPVGKFGLACQFDCHCQGGCGGNFTKCEGDCLVDWSGPTCQIHKLSVNQKLTSIRNPGSKYPAGYAERTVDGDISSCIHANATGGTERLRIELSSVHRINEIRIINTQKLPRQDRSWIKNMEIRVGNSSTISKGRICSTYKDKFPETTSVTIQCKETGKYIWFIKRSTPFRFLSICEVQFFGTDCNSHTWGEDCRQFCGRCAGGVTCDVVTGKCPYDQCEVGWTGDRCNTEIPLTTSIDTETSDSIVIITTPSMSTYSLTSATESLLSQIMTESAISMMTYVPKSTTVTGVQGTSQYSTVLRTADTTTTSLSADMLLLMTTDISLKTSGLCNLKVDIGRPCSQDSSQMFWRYYFEAGVCFPGIYLGCGGNLNRFLNRRDCESACFTKTTVKPIVTTDVDNAKVVPWSSKDVILSSSIDKEITQLDSSYETIFMDSLMTETGILQVTERQQYDTIFSDHQSSMDLHPSLESFFTSFKLDTSTSSTEKKFTQLDSSYENRFMDSFMAETNRLHGTENQQYGTAFSDHQSSIELDISLESFSTSSKLHTSASSTEKEFTQLDSSYETRSMESSKTESFRLRATESKQYTTVFSQSYPTGTEINSYSKFFTSHAIPTITTIPVSPSADTEYDTSVLHLTSTININPTKSFSLNTGQWESYSTDTGLEMSSYVEKGYTDSSVIMQDIPVDVTSDSMHSDSLASSRVSGYLAMYQDNTMIIPTSMIYTSLTTESFHSVPSDFERNLELNIYSASTTSSLFMFHRSQYTYPSTTISSTFKTDVERPELHPPKMSSVQTFSSHMTDSSYYTDQYEHSSTIEGKTALTSYFVTTDDTMPTLGNENTTSWQANTNEGSFTDMGMSATTVVTTTVVPISEVQEETMLFTITNIVPILIALSGAVLIALLLIILVQRHSKKKQSFELNRDFINYSTKDYEMKPSKAKLTARDDGVRGRMLSLRPAPQPKITLTETETSITSENEVTIPLPTQDSEEYPNIQYIDV